MSRGFDPERTQALGDGIADPFDLVIAMVGVYGEAQHRTASRHGRWAKGSDVVALDLHEAGSLDGQAIVADPDRHYGSDPVRYGHLAIA